MATFWRSIRFTIVFFVFLGLLYPFVTAGIGNLFFPFQAKGSIVQWQGKAVGSELIAQNTTDPGLFHPRPSVTKYAGNATGGSNLGPTNPALVAEVRKNLQSVEKENPGTPVNAIPSEMVESSASGIDPDISVQDALIQVPRIAHESGLSQTYLEQLINQDRKGRFLGLWGGDPMVNVLQLNMAIIQKAGR